MVKKLERGQGCMRWQGAAQPHNDNVDLHRRTAKRPPVHHQEHHTYECISEYVVVVNLLGFRIGSKNYRTMKITPFKAFT